MQPRVSQRATTWTALFHLTDTDEYVAAGSWTDPTTADAWALHPWFRDRRATFRGLIPLIQPDDLISELGGTR